MLHEMGNMRHLISDIRNSSNIARVVHNYIHTYY